MAELDDEDAKLVTLARAAHARTNAPEGAAVRDDTGRTYAGVGVALPSLRLSALQLAVAMASSSGAGALEAAALVTTSNGSDKPDEAGLSAVRDLASGIPVYVADTNGDLQQTHHT